MEQEMKTASDAFVAGRSKQSWDSFKKEYFPDKFSKHQIDILVLMCEGQLMFIEDRNTLILEDADHNSCIVRYDTFKILLNSGMIETKNIRPNIDTLFYDITEKTRNYLIENHYERIKDL